MIWANWSDFLNMGGDGLYVWAAYLVVALVVLSEIVVLRFSRHSILEHLGRFAGARRRGRGNGAGRVSR